ncbi:DNA polymerase III subunit delta [Microlunatus sp. Y2014]|uniref:DNA polymerase III subunit delta n=1 Tax=Microlunatus sp. Y2014 TaxID=3418488 RepID=UPI003DA72FCC
MAASRSRTSSRSAAGDPEGPVFGRVLLVTGPESLLADRVVAAALERARTESPEVETTEAEAESLDAGRLAEITGGSLFASRRVAVVRRLADLPAELSDQVISLATDPDPDIGVVLVHGGGNKGKGVLDKLKKAGADVVDCQAPKAWELPQFVKAEFRRHGDRVDDEVGQALVQAVGHDLRSLSGAVAQLHSDAEGAITAELVGRYFGGRNEVTSFAVADAVLAGRTNVALEQLRWALATGAAPVLITSALAMNLRGLGKLVTAAGGQRDADLARDVGVPTWKLKTMRAQARGWDQRGLATALTVVARTDADIKGAAEDPGYALERAVLEIVRARRS